MDQELLPPESRFEVNITITSGVADEFDDTLLGEIADFNTQLISLCRKYKVSILMDENTNLMLNKALPSREIDSVNLDNHGNVKLFELL